ncbi:pyridoxamine 5'-phosphate oxidase family protein [Leeia sp. TBRC 13508]|uniref:Pyridoxamine 5'-phosphate oxidase family protein n=1 Tax=Leeia speluncae TaxID=2884804 RepID=A0ABS8DB17_9NEIS|nr:pyridoxamine 5'-phosphate oxidase family protein [Leeia speluncae]MCB6184803.1 pyridoxamine 5'-phosphate oxidase family protein [Leeia speluncae]
MVNPFFDNLDETLVHAWRLIEQGVNDPRVGAHLPVIATVDEMGFPQVRTVVLRAARSATREVIFYTDIRSQKIKDLQHQQHLVMQFYDHAQKIQVQLKGIATIHQQDAIADQYWQKAKPHSKRAYLVTPGPGEKLLRPGNGLARDLSYRAPTDTESLPGKKHFAVITIKVSELHWLYLAPFNQRRAKFCWLENQSLTAEWLVP